MSEFINIYKSPVDNHWGSWIVFIILWLVSLLLLSIIVFGILSAINYWFRPINDGYGTIVGMDFEPAHYSTHYVYNAATKTSMPVTTWHPNAWKLDIKIEDEVEGFYLPAEKYIKHKVGEQIRVLYTTGRLWKSISIKSAFV